LLLNSIKEARTASPRQQGEVFSAGFLYEKLDYIHNNPVVDMIVENSWDYLHSSARNYADMDGLLDVLF